MTDFFTALSVSDVIQLLGIIISLVTSVVAIIISVLSLKQNSKMIADSTRPYIWFWNLCESGSLLHYCQKFWSKFGSHRRFQM